ncbi:response regulator [Candidatus Uhrbacteria bacterium]|nr:response regulator [Candidatus Uhrbacteria bacterium]
MEEAVKKILIVEDETLLREIFKTQLAREGFSVFTAADGAAGLAEALARQPDLILLDLLMPKMDGITMLKALRQDQWGARVPVMVLTNLSDAAAVAAAKESGVAYQDYLMKLDWKLEDIVKKIKDKLSLK